MANEGEAGHRWHWQSMGYIESTILATRLEELVKTRPGRVYKLVGKRNRPNEYEAANFEINDRSGDRV